VATNGTAPLRQRHVGELMGQLASDAGLLVRQELELAKAELRERADEIRAELADAAEVGRGEGDELAAKGKEMASGAGMFGAAGVAALLALGALTACLILLLDRWFATDLAALIVTAGWLLVAAALALAGRDRLRRSGEIHRGSWLPTRTLAAVQNVGSETHVVPTQTIETVKEDVQWVKTRGKSDAR
jgi:Putative Actinobacterial Holin-X, holin superfamily III